MARSKQNRHLPSSPPTATTIKASKGKKKSLSLPCKLADNESLAFVASPFGPIDTAVVTTFEKDIILDRLKKEIVDKFQFTLSPKAENGKRKRSERGIDEPEEENAAIVPQGKSKSHHSPQKTSAVVKERVVVGTNQCTRALEAAVNQKGPVPSLVLLARDVRPPTMLAHIPAYSRKLQIPTMVLPGKSTTELGKILGAKTVAIVLFLPDRKHCGKEDHPKLKACHKGIDSYIDFARSKVSTAAMTPST